MISGFATAPLNCCQSIVLIDFALRHAESFLGTPTAVHQLIVSWQYSIANFVCLKYGRQYEFVRSSSVIEKQEQICLHSHKANRGDFLGHNSVDAMRNVKRTLAHYEGVVKQNGARDAASVLKIIAKEVDRDGLLGGKDKNDDEAPCVLSAALSPSNSLKIYLLSESDPGI